MTENKYNGWTNYETWNVALWLGNEEGSQRHFDSLAQECWDEAKPKPHPFRTERPVWTKEESAALTFADLLKNEIEESMPDLGASMFADLLGAAMSEVNWREIAEHYIDDVDKTEEEDEEDETEDESEPVDVEAA